MAGIRTYTTLDPNVWRFPRWKNNVFYPAGSFVAEEKLNVFDSEQVTWSFYVSILDVAVDNKLDPASVPPAVAAINGAGSYAPSDSDSDWVNHSIYGTNPWILAFDTTADSISAQLTAQIQALSGLFPLLGIDSDVGILFGQDSDLQLQIWQNDSDITMEIHDRSSADSDLLVRIRDNDSDILMARHDAWLWDSDRDSEANRRDDSDRHDHQAADSDLQVQIYDNDSDILMEIHDRKGGDSDLWYALDSDMLAMHIKTDSDSDRLTNFIKRMAERDSDVALKLDQHDSDIEALFNTIWTGGGGGNTGFPVGSIMAFASTKMPIGFAYADGSTYNVATYPDLFEVLGTNVLPDLRNQFLRGYNDGTDGYGATRNPLSQQSDAFGSHNHGGGNHAHSYDRTETGIDGSDVSFKAENNDGNFVSRTSGASGNIIATQGGNETRPKNTMVVYGIALYNGAGVIYDSEIIEAVLREKMVDIDSDFQALYNRTGYHSETYNVDSDKLAGWTYTTMLDNGDLVNSDTYEEIEVYLNGVSVTQWTAAAGIFTLNFPIRNGIDIVQFKLRR
jgi:hypothetical protein